jgi:hypothetical protein
LARRLQQQVVQLRQVLEQSVAESADYWARVARRQVVRRRLELVARRQVQHLARLAREWVQVLLVH